MASNIQVKKDYDRIVIQKPWRNMENLFLLPFTLVWNLAIFGSIFAGGIGLMAMPHFWVGLGLLYYTAANLVNKTIITADKKNLSIRHEPLPWFGNKDLSLKNIKQFYVKEHVKRKKDQLIKTYEIRALTNKKEELKIIRNGILKEPHDARYLERQLEEFLGIPDHRVLGEYQGETKPLPHDVARNDQKQLDPIAISLEDLKQDYVLDYHDKTYIVKYAQQMDWDNGETDHFYQLVHGSERHLLYMKRDFGIKVPYIEEKTLTEILSQLTDQPLDKLPESIQYNSDVYFREGKSNGKIFKSKNGRGVAARQVFYTTQNHEKSIRFVREQNQTIEVYTGFKELGTAFQDILPREE